MLCEAPESAFATELNRTAVDDTICVNKKVRFVLSDVASVVPLPLAVVGLLTSRGIKIDFAVSTDVIVMSTLPLKLAATDVLP